MAAVSAAAIVFSLGVPEVSLVRKNVITEAEHHALELAKGLSVCEITEYIEKSTPLGNLVIPEENLPELDEELSTFLAPFSLIKIKIFDLKGEIVYCSDDSLIGKVEEANPKLARALAGETISELESKAEMVDLQEATRIDVKVVETYLPLSNQRGEVLGVFEIYTDVSGHLKRAEKVAFYLVGGLALVVMVVFAFLTAVIKRLTGQMDEVAARGADSRRETERSRTFLKSIIDSLPDELMVLSTDRDILLANRNVREKFQGDPVVQKLKCHQVSHGIDVPCSKYNERCPLETALEEKRPVSCTHQHTGPGGSSVFVEVTVSPVLDELGQVTQIIENTRDITEQIRTAMELEAASRAKSAFLANMSHEIRTPLTAIMGFADMIAVDDPDDETRNEYLSVIQRNGKHLLALINDILDLAKIEAGKLAIEAIKCRPADILVDVANLVSLRAAEKGLDLKTRFTTAVPDAIETDPTRLKQALVNLVGNAIKFTKQGEVRLEMGFLEAEGDRPPLLEFKVSDTGIGMDADTQAQLFKPFSQGDASISRRFGGTGLGLAITHSITEMLGGEIQVFSEPGTGTTFTMTIATGDIAGTKMVKDSDQGPSRSGSAKAKPSDRPDLTGLKVLFAEDGRDNQVLVSTILRKAGAEVEIAENGQIAVDKAETAKYDIILMDQQMPVMDGLEATQIIRGRGYAGPILALSANAMEKDRQLSLQAGCVGHLTKPINRRKLLEALAELCFQTTESPTT